MHSRLLLMTFGAAFSVLNSLHGADSEVTGTFTGDGKSAKIAFVSTVKGTELA